MLVRRWSAVVTVGLLAGCGAGCAAGSQRPPVATSGTAATASAPQARTESAAASCVVGPWRSVELDLVATGGMAVTAHGGAGIRLTIAGDGRSTADFTGMAPVEFGTSGGPVHATGSFTYGGTVTAPLRLPPAGERAGVWSPGTGAVDFGDVTATVRLTAPVRQTITDVKLSDVAGMAGVTTGGTIDRAPLFSTGRYRCDGTELILSPPDDQQQLKGTWTLTRA
jgi:hypothetical protein